MIHLAEKVQGRSTRLLRLLDSIDHDPGWHHAQGAEANAEAAAWQELSRYPNQARPVYVESRPQLSGRAKLDRASGPPASFPVGDWTGLAYNCTMQISLEPDLEARLNRIASEAGKPATQVVEELVSNYIDHDCWFKQEVSKGLLSLDAGRFLSHDDVRRKIDRILAS